ncbi:MAG TPA: hypothetical protein VE398_15825, partial [Acidobacteriota bacterium]|nr:hypothetical protein [Acidobacteriota bacterium]
NVALSESELYAATKGELFCLDPATGHVRWHNPLKGLGRGLIAIAAAGVETNQMSLLERRKREEQAAAAAAAAGASS